MYVGSLDLQLSHLCDVDAKPGQVVMLTRGWGFTSDAPPVSVTVHPDSKG